MLTAREIELIKKPVCMVSRHSKKASRGTCADFGVCIRTGADATATNDRHLNEQSQMRAFKLSVMAMRLCSRSSQANTDQWTSMRLDHFSDRLKIRSCTGHESTVLVMPRRAKDGTCPRVSRYMSASTAVLTASSGGPLSPPICTALG